MIVFTCDRCGKEKKTKKVDAPNNLICPRCGDVMSSKQVTKFPDAGQGNLQRERLKDGGNSTGRQRGIRSFHRGGKE